MYNMTEKTVDQCMHVLLAVHCEGIYDTQKDELKEYYGCEIFEEAESTLYNSRTFQLIFG